MKTYAGVGARATAPEFRHLMTTLAEQLARARWTLRTGGAQGADTAFMDGADRGELYLPWPRYRGHLHATLERPTAAAVAIAAEHHPAWVDLDWKARMLHGRNSHVVLGRNCDDPVDFLVCWTPSARVVGGTGQAIRVARAYDVPVYNLANPLDVAQVSTYA